MKYVSTRGRVPVADFETVVRAGLAEDGGLYVPESWPTVGAAEIAALRDLDYPEIARRVIDPFVGDALGDDELGGLIDDAYRDFGRAEITPLVEIGEDRWLLELFHGPTLAFKDLALQVLGRLFGTFLGRDGGSMTIVGATSGDTGSAAIAACRGRPGIRLFMLHPRGRVSEIQRRQMTTVRANNIFNIAIEGTFDDCQGLVKGLFADIAFRDRMALSAVNSINWARVMAQVVYYFYAASRLPQGKPPVFAVPTGNFGDVYAGYVAHRMGLPVHRLIVATNVNDILDRALRGGCYRPRDVVATSSPSMDIQLASNFERLLFGLYDRDGGRIRAAMAELSASGQLVIDSGALARARAIFASARVDEEATRQTINDIYKSTGMLIDPHTAVGIAAAGQGDTVSGHPLVALATAHPAKFPGVIEAATGIRPALPPRLADILSRQEKYDTLPAEPGAIKTFIRAHVL